MALPKFGDLVGETTLSTGNGAITLAGAIDGFGAFSTIGDGQVYYTIREENNKEVGIGTLSGNVLSRTTILATNINGVHTIGGGAMNINGGAEVFCTANSHLFNYFSDALDKLDGIEAGATDDQTAAEVPFDDTTSNTGGSTVQEAIDLLIESFNTQISEIQLQAPSNIQRVFIVTSFANGYLGDAELFAKVIMTDTFTLNQSAPGSYAQSVTPAAADTVISIEKNGAQIGTITFSAGSTDGVFDVPSDVVYVISESIGLRQVGAADATLSDVAISIEMIGE